MKKPLDINNFRKAAIKKSAAAKLRPTTLNGLQLWLATAGLIALVFGLIARWESAKIDAYLEYEQKLSALEYAQKAAEQEHDRLARSEIPTTYESWPDYELRQSKARASTERAASLGEDIVKLRDESWGMRNDFLHGTFYSDEQITKIIVYSDHRVTLARSVALTSFLLALALLAVKIVDAIYRRRLATKEATAAITHEDVINEVRVAMRAAWQDRCRALEAEIERMEDEAKTAREAVRIRERLLASGYQTDAGPAFESLPALEQALQDTRDRLEHEKTHGETAIENSLDFMRLSLLKGSLTGFIVRQAA